ncbi:MAG: glutamate-5-semialdehyde dehydrogenase, partial [Sedimentisphaerales bacterium]|nr:glutamate-5-semialdehyde dehydrogenase [Sedimentisphaerales bacterium]
MIEQIAEQARQASVILGSMPTEQKNQALAHIAKALTAAKATIIAANETDLAQAHQEQLNPALLKRLKFDAAKLHEAVSGVNGLIKLDDPVGQTLSATELSKSLDLYKVSCPIGVLGIVFESRPDALVQISCLALKSGNAVLLKGGREAANTNRILADIVTQASAEAGLPQGWLALLETREDVSAMLAMDEYIDLVIPRGSNAFVKYVMDNTRIPVLGHADGICHVYVDGSADLDMAARIVVDAKCQYAAVCNAMETLLVDKTIAEEFLLKVK